MISRRTAAALVVLLVGMAMPALAQVVPAADAGGFPAAQPGGLPFEIGGGGSRFNTDCGTYIAGATCYMNGITVWADWNLVKLPRPSFLRGLSVEIEGRDLNFGRPSFLTNSALGDAGSNMRQDTGLGGVTYTWRPYRRIRPYGKALVGLGSMDFPPLPASPSWYRHDNRTITAFGAGVDVRAGRNIWVRADWEYQFWPDLFGLPNAITPSGVTVGAMYDFRGWRAR